MVTKFDALHIQVALTCSALQKKFRDMVFVEQTLLISL